MQTFVAVTGIVILLASLLARDAYPGVGNVGVLVAAILLVAGIFWKPNNAQKAEDKKLRQFIDQMLSADPHAWRVEIKTNDIELYMGRSFLLSELMEKLIDWYNLRYTITTQSTTIVFAKK